MGHHPTNGHPRMGTNARFDAVGFCQLPRCKETSGDTPLVATPGTLACTSGIITTIANRPPIKRPPKRADFDMTPRWPSFLLVKVIANKADDHLNVLVAGDDVRTSACLFSEQAAAHDRDQCGDDEKVEQREIFSYD